MFNINLNWLKIIKENIPLFTHTPRRLDWIKALISPVNKIYQEFLIAYDVFLLKIRCNAQVNNLQKRLNDRYDPANAGIYITDGLTVPKYYLYRAVELKPVRYLYSNWKPMTNYIAGEYAVYQNKVWKAALNNTGSVPGSGNLHWTFHKNVEFLRTKAEFALVYNFIIMVPSTVVFNQMEMRAIVDYYRFSGTHFKIVIF